MLCRKISTSGHVGRDYLERGPWRTSSANTMHESKLDMSLSTFSAPACLVILVNKCAKSRGTQCSTPRGSSFHSGTWWRTQFHTAVWKTHGVLCMGAYVPNCTVRTGGTRLRNIMFRNIGEHRVEQIMWNTNYDIMSPASLFFCVPP